MLMTALFLVLPSCSKDDVNVTLTPSEEVVNAFQQKYPDVKNVKWEILVGAYEAEFIYSGTYSENGQHIVLDKYNPQIQISAESETKRSIFREKDKTKRSKKESAQHSKSRNKSFVMTSVSAL